MAQATPTFRIFVSSTFSDLKAERDALNYRVWPRLRELCEGRGARFQAIDLRWGVSDEAGLDQQTMPICLGEIDRCRQVSPKPNFIVLLGQRYGWRPLPPQIDAREFEATLSGVSEADRQLLLWDEAGSSERKPWYRLSPTETRPSDRTGWYRRDDNAVPAVYELQARVLNLEPGQTEAQRAARMEAEDRDWRVAEPQLWGILNRASAPLRLEAYDRLKYEASATEQEIRRGALRVEGPEKHVHCFFRRITNRGDLEAAARAGWPGSDFLEVDGAGNPDTGAQAQLEVLKAELGRRLPKGNVVELDAEWVGLERGPVLPVYGGTGQAAEPKATGTEAKEPARPEHSPITLDHLDRLCDAIYAALERTIEAELDELEDLDSVTRERQAHWQFGRDRAAHFTGRAEPLAKIADYLAQETPQPLVAALAPRVSGDGRSRGASYRGSQPLARYPSRWLLARGTHGIVATRPRPSLVQPTRPVGECYSPQP